MRDLIDYRYGRRGRTRSLAAGPIIAMLVAYSPASGAQELREPSAGTAPRAGSELEEVIVTAERRATRLEDTPISATVLTARELESQRIVSFSDVELLVPGLTYTQITHQEAYFSIRGTSIKNDAPGTDLGVSVFVDDVPMTGIGDNDVDLFDLQSIEVLRGPQGTLFGRNVTGGLINVHTAPPSFQPSFKEEFTYGSDNLMEARGFATGPLRGQLAAKLTFSTRRRDDYIENVTLQHKNYGENWDLCAGKRSGSRMTISNCW
jgi:iron complex outermembrane receptor protein